MQADGFSGQSAQAEVVRLRDELQMRDRLVQQLSQELFRLVKGNAGLVPTSDTSERHQTEMQALRDRVREVEEQVAFYQDQLADRDSEIYQLRQSVQELGDRSRMLEQTIQELPNVYRSKFEDRLGAIKERVQQLQQENRNLQAELQSVSYRLAVSSRRPGSLDLPEFAGETA
jgi:chromosome segregation ATPase